MVNQSNWTACMKRLHREDPSLAEDELRESCEHEEAFADAQNQMETSFLDESLLTSLLIASTIYDLLPPNEREQVPFNDLFDNLTINEPPEDFFSQDIIDQYQQLLEEQKQYNRIEDPKTVENKEWQDQQRIQDMTGMFGDTEAAKQGLFDVYSGEGVLIPWVTMNDDSVCEDCQELEEKGPYPVEEYPEPPHYGCRCEPGDPVIALPGEPGNTEPTKEEIEELYTYNIDDNPAVNEYLRTGEVPEYYYGTEEDLIKQSQELDNLMEKYTSTEDQTLYRGVDGVFDDKVVGDYIEDKAFASTTTDFEVATEFGNTVFEIELPAGSNEIPVDDVLRDAVEKDLTDKTFGDMHLGEDEHLIPRGTGFDVVYQYSRESEWGDTINVLVLKPAE